MTIITITGDATQKALQNTINGLIQKYGSDLVLQISENLRFENQNNEIEYLKSE